MGHFLERKKVHEFLTKSQIIKQIVENDMDAIVVTDERSIIEFINRQFTRLFGYEEHEAIGRCISDLIVHEYAREAPEETNDCLQKNVKRGTETVRSRKMGRKINVLSRISPIMENNETIGGFAYYRNVRE
jgi:PAS domain S-box-containing protein